MQEKRAVVSGATLKSRNQNQFPSNSHWLHSHALPASASRAGNRASSRGAHLASRAHGLARDTDRGLGPATDAGGEGGSETIHRLRPEKTRQHAEGPGFESRHLHNNNSYSIR